MFRICRMGYSLPDTTVPRMSSHCYKLFDLFSFDFSHKTVVFGRRTLYCCHKISGEDVMSLSQNFILGSLQHIPYQRSLSYYHFLLFFLSIFHKKYPGFSRTSPNSFVESFIAEIVAATDPSNDNPPVA